MEATRSGVTGRLNVAKHVEEELRLDLGLVPIPCRQIEEEIVASLGNLINNHGNVTHIAAQVNLPNPRSTKTR